MILFIYIFIRLDTVFDYFATYVAHHGYPMSLYCYSRRLPISWQISIKPTRINMILSFGRHSSSSPCGWISIWSTPMWVVLGYDRAHHTHTHTDYVFPRREYKSVSVKKIHIFFVDIFTLGTMGSRWSVSFARLPLWFFISLRIHWYTYVYETTPT